MVSRKKTQEQTPTPKNPSRFSPSCFSLPSNSSRFLRLSCSSRMVSRKVAKEQTPKKEKLDCSFDEILKRTKIMDFKNCNNSQETEERSGISTEFNVVHQCKIKDETREYIQISTQLKLSDDTWPTKDMPVAIVYFAGLEKKREMANSKIAMMQFYSPEEEEEERLLGVSTKPTLYTDPWKIKKRLTPSDLGHLCRLLLQTNMVGKYILPYLSSDEVNKVQSKEGFRVSMWDQDTESQHSLILKKWSTSKSYVLVDGWGQKFVNRRGLKAGDDVGIYWDPYTARLNFHVIQRAVPQASN